MAEDCDLGEKVSFLKSSDRNFRQHYYSPRSRDRKVIAESLNLQKTF